jgi:hypothetical protein
LRMTMPDGCKRRRAREPRSTLQGRVQARVLRRRRPRGNLPGRWSSKSATPRCPARAPA